MWAAVERGEIGLTFDEVVTKTLSAERARTRQIVNKIGGPESKKQE